MLNKFIGEKIKKFRIRKGMSQLDLELAIDSSVGSVSRFETGKTNPTKETILKIIKILDLKGKDAASLFDINFDDDFIRILEISKNINTLDLKELVQRAVNDIVFEFNYLGSILWLLKDEEFIEAYAFTKTWYTDFVLKLVPQLVNKKYGSINEEKFAKNLLVQTIKQKKVIYREKILNYCIPIISKTHTQIVERFTSPKSCIAFPLIVNKKCLGTIFFAKNRPETFEDELPLLEKFCEYLAASIDNAQKFEILQEKINLR